MKFYLKSLIKCLISIFTFKLVVLIFQTWVGYYACILHAPDKYTFVNVLNSSFVMFFLALSLTSLLNSLFNWDDVLLIAKYEILIFASMVIANTVIQLCRGKMILNENNEKKLLELFLCSKIESQESFLGGPFMMIASQALSATICFYRKMCCCKSNISKLVEKNDDPSLTVAMDLCTESNEESLEKNEEMAMDFQGGKQFCSENLESRVEYTEENTNICKYANKLENICIDNENNSKDKEEKDNLNEIASPKERKKIKPSPRLFRVPSNSSNQNNELDSTNSEITSHNDTCLSTLDTDEDLSLTLLGIEDSASSKSVFSLTDPKQFASELNLGSSSSPRIKKKKINVSINENFDTSVQFPMDLTPKKSENLTKEENSTDVAGCKNVGSYIDQNTSVSNKDSENLELLIPMVIKKNEEKKFQKMLREFKLLGDPELEEKFTNAVISFETMAGCNFLEWLCKITKPYKDISKFMKFVVGKRNKEIIENNIREWMKEVFTSFKNIEINSDTRRKFYGDFQLAFMKNEYTYKKLRRDCKKLLNDIEEDLSPLNQFDTKNLANYYGSFALLKDDYEIMCEENKERSREEKFFVDYLSVDNTLKTKIKSININTELEKDREEKVETTFSEKNPNIDISLEDEVSPSRRNISRNQLETSKISSLEKNEDIRAHGAENISFDGSIISNLEKYLKENQEKTIKSDNRQNKKKCLLDSRTCELNLIPNKKSTSEAECLVKSFNSNPNPSYPISIKAKNKDVYSISDSEEEDDDLIEVFDKIQKSFDEKKSMSAEEALTQFGMLYYGGNSFFKAKKYIKGRHARNNERRKEQEEIILNTFKLIHEKLQKLNAKTVGSGKI